MQVSFVCVTNLLNSSYHARVLLAPRQSGALHAGGHNISIDARPSDAINLALRFRSPIYVKKVAKLTAHTAAGLLSSAGSLEDVLQA